MSATGVCSSMNINSSSSIRHCKHIGCGIRSGNVDAQNYYIGFAGSRKTFHVKLEPSLTNFWRVLSKIMEPEL